MTSRKDRARGWLRPAAAMVALALLSACAGTPQTRTAPPASKPAATTARAATAADRTYAAEPEPEGDCDPNYTGACLTPDSSDYDCAGGSGDGPEYTGPVQSVGSDPYGLDRDGDGLACESS
jgi:hypothetical protein